MTAARDFSTLERRLLDAYQHNFPRCPRPYAAIANALGVSETAILEMLDRFIEEGVVSRVGAVVRPHKAGWSALAAIAVPPERLDEVAARVTSRSEVNHNYEREHRFNLWFVVAGPDEASVDETIRDIELEVGLSAMVLPLVKPFRIDLGFPIQWN